ncbi:unnamed protein product, partial [Urochloa humidicola]
PPTACLPSLLPLPQNPWRRSNWWLTAPPALEGLGSSAAPRAARGEADRWRVAWRRQVKRRRTGTPPHGCLPLPPWNLAGTAPEVRARSSSGTPCSPIPPAAPASPSPPAAVSPSRPTAAASPSPLRGGVWAAIAPAGAGVPRPAAGLRSPLLPRGVRAARWWRIPPAEVACAMGEASRCGSCGGAASTGRRRSRGVATEAGLAGSGGSTGGGASLGSARVQRPASFFLLFEQATVRCWRRCAL